MKPPANDFKVLLNPKKSIVLKKGNIHQQSFFLDLREVWVPHWFIADELIAKWSRQYLHKHSLSLLCEQK